MNKDWQYWTIHKQELQKLTDAEIEQITTYPLSEEAMKFDAQVRDRVDQIRARPLEISH